MKVIVLNNQSLIDVAIQHTGMVENCFAIAVANDLSVSDLLTPGMIISIPENISNNTDVLNYYTAKKIHPATGISSDITIPTLKGIGYMQLGNSFKVS